MPETILVVDDDPDIARFVEVNLRSAGYDVSRRRPSGRTWSCST
jgi:DNA-binding response OmpR family regulator